MVNRWTALLLEEDDGLLLCRAPFGGRPAGTVAAGSREATVELFLQAAGSRCCFAVAVGHLLREKKTRLLWGRRRRCTGRGTSWPTVRETPRSVLLDEAGRCGGFVRGQRRRKHWKWDQRRSWPGKGEKVGAGVQGRLVSLGEEKKMASGGILGAVWLSLGENQK